MNCQDWPKYLLPQQTQVVSEQFNKKSEMSILESFRGVIEGAEGNLMYCTLRDDSGDPKAIIEVSRRELHDYKIPRKIGQCFDFYVIKFNEDELFYFRPVYPDIY